MSVPEPTTSNTVPTLEQDLSFIKFPPFPKPPPGVIIMPFKGFKPRGIQLFSEPGAGGNDAAEEEDPELDALGIPTVELRVRHTTDECKSNSRKKRKKKKAATIEAVLVKKLPWYEEWEEGEDLRVTKVRYDPNVSPVDRLFQSAYDFRTGRPWPPIASGLNNLWDQFRLFTGLLVNPSVFRKIGAKKFARAESPDFESDDDDDPAVNDEDSVAAGDSRPTKRQRSAEGLDVDDDDDESPFSDPHKLDEEIREEKITIFLSDPEKVVRTFLSSYMREHGLIWTERNLIYAPRLISFFLAFVVRNRVILEPAYQRGLKRALETIEWAKKELPLTHKVGQSIPDAFNEACRECFGRQGGMNWSVGNATTTTMEQKDAGITVTDISNGIKTNVALPTEAEMQLKDVIEDNVDMEVSLDTSTMVVSPINENAIGEDPGGWGNGSGNGWGEGWGDKESWNEDPWTQSGPGDDETQEGQGMNVEAVMNPGPDTKWADSDPSWSRDPASLLSLFGPSVFPLTHTTGIVECSTRRVSAIYFPASHPKNVPSPSSQESLGKATADSSEGQDWATSACGVEAELDARFAKVILEPWGREEGDISRPEIWTTSRGPVIDPKNPSKVSTHTAGTVVRKPHNPFTDSITLLVEPSFAETLALVPGLGLGAMWIEIARQKSGAAADTSIGVAQVDDSTPGRFWYHEDVTGIFPSFYTPRVKE